MCSQVINTYLTVLPCLTSSHMLGTSFSMGPGACAMILGDCRKVLNISLIIPCGGDDGPGKTVGSW